MKNREQVAKDLLECALSCEPYARLIGNVTAYDIAALAASCLTSCPKCIAEPGCNIDCDLCDVIHVLKHVGGAP